MGGCQLDTLGRDQAGVGIMLRWQVCVYGLHHFLCRMRSGHRQYLWELFRDGVAFCPQATSDDDFTVFPHGLADGLQRFLNSRVNKATGINDHQVCLLVIGADVIAFGAQLGDDLFRIH